jgi:DNA-binding CsgD family transcriptional regulator/transcriptional regulator with PAS, ATPase and Fis domain
MNEELQSTNEELETSKEELQSLNEELTTVNNQLQDKLGDLETANNDMANLLNCTEVAIIFLDSEFRIKRFTRPAMRLFNLIATDLDRPIGDITPKFTESTLREDVEQVLRNLALQEKQVQTSDGCWRSRRITPYRTRDDHIEGVVLTFTDVTQVRHAAEQTKRLAGVLRDSNNRDAVSDGNEFDRSPLDVLTDRELTVFRLIGAGVKTSEMAKRLHLSVKTIETYRDRVRRKLKFENSTELSHYAAQWALASNSSSLE